MTVSEFLSELDSRIAKYDLLCHPFYKAWSAGKLSKQDLREYGRQYLRHVEAFPSYLEEFATRLPQSHLRKAVLANRDEEMGDNGARAHAELWLDFIEGMEGERSRANHAVPEVADLVNSFHSVAREGSPEEVLAAFYAYESQVPRVAAEKARGLRQMYGADDRTCGYFTLHTTADIYHSRVWRSQLERIFEENPSSGDRALKAAESAAASLWHAIDGIESARMRRAA
jgi:pyrroloquinoline-quinone synthase